MRRLLSIPVFMMITAPLFAQGELAEQPRIFFRNEESLAFTLNSNGFGINGRYAKRINARRKTIYDLDLISIKHRKEVKISNYFYNNKSFVFGKENSFFTLRGGYGKQVEMFRKVDKGGISIRRFYSAGPSIGFLKPIYYEVFHSGGGGISDLYLETEKFSTATHQQYIYGKASFFKGLDEISVVPGIYGRFGFMFEYSRNDLALHALETGVAIDVFIKEIPILATEKNEMFFFGLFVSYRFGKIIDARGIIEEDDLAY